MVSFKGLTQKTIEMAKEDDVFHYLTDNLKQTFVKLPEPKLGKDLKCPNCGSREGFKNLITFVPERNVFSWTCFEDACLHEWVKNNHTFSGKFHRDAPNPSAYGLESINWDELDQPHQFKDEWKIWAKEPFLNMIFHGLPGRGKTFAAKSILSECIRNGYSATFYKVSDIYMKWRTEVKEGGDIDLLLKIVDYDVIALDDIGHRFPSEGFQEFLYLILDKRSDLKKSCIATTNFSYKDLCHQLGDACMSRLSASRKVYYFQGHDKRHLNGRQGTLETSIPR